MTAPEVVYCPLCELPHRRAAEVCDGCSQPLHEPVDVAQLREEHAARKQSIVYALVAVVAMLVLNVAFVEHVGGFVITTAPLGWLIWNGLRFRALSQRLARASARGTERGAR
jgi:hypothetical protein